MVLSFTPKGNIYAGLAARAVGVPIIPNVSGLGTGFIRGGVLQRVQQTLYREAFVTASIVFFQNEDDSRLFEQLGVVRPEQVRLLPGSGVDCRHFMAKPLAEREPGEAHLLFVGRLLGDKGVRELADAMRLVRRHHPAVSLTLLGDLGAANRTAITPSEVAGWEAEGLLRHIARTNDVRPFLADADAVVLPSYREGMPRSLLEAAATGRPLLAANVPGCRELVTDGGNGLLFEARSAESLASAITQFAATPIAERRRWGQAARQLAETKFDERHVTRAYVDLILAKRNSSR
jgi:glycosyltransferase involved in cell wall biosynthesis